MRNYITLFLFIFGILRTSAQNHDVIWKLLLKTPGQPAFVMNPLAYDPAWYHDSLPPNPIKCIPFKMGSDLYLFVQGSGRLFRMVYDSAAGTFKTIRLDSTRFTGYNFQAFPFSYKGSIYNIGGYGFWRRNGLLRRFNNTVHQWDIIPLNREIPIIIHDRGDLLGIDEEEGKIMVAGYKELNDGLKDRLRNIDKMLELDLQTGDWTEKGILSDYLKKVPFENSHLIAFTKSGLLLRISYDDFIYLSFFENRILRIETSFWDHFSFKNGEIRDYVNFVIDSTLYSYNARTGVLDKQQLKPSDFIDIHQPIYISPAKKYPYLIALMLSLIGVTMAVIGMRRSVKNRNKKSPIQKGEMVSNENLLTDKLLLENQELQVLQRILDNSLRQTITSIEELNTVLGVAKRNADVQKKLRSDSIQSINHKLGILWGTDEPVIDKKRADADKRSFEYFITQKFTGPSKDYLAAHQTQPGKK